jgi:K+-sensing histidine kinase KdpD
VIGFLDYVTGPLYSFGIFYLLPVALVAWAAGRREAMLVSFLSALVWLLADRETLSYRVAVSVNVWNTVVRLAFFAVISYAIAPRSRRSSARGARRGTRVARGPVGPRNGESLERAPVAGRGDG